MTQLPASDVVPIYLVIDVSYSMVSVLDALGRGLTTVIDELRQDPRLATMLRLAIVSFSENAVLELPPTELRDVEPIELEARRGTKYGEAFALTAQTLRDDVASLTKAGKTVRTATVIFCAYGMPYDSDWNTPLAELHAQHPYVVALGIGRVDPQILKAIALPPELAFVTRSDTELESVAKDVPAMLRSAATRLREAGRESIPVWPPGTVVQVPRFVTG